MKVCEEVARRGFLTDFQFFGVSKAPLSHGTARGMLRGMLPALQPHPPLRKWMPKACDVTRSVNMAQAGAAEFVNHHGTIDLRAGLFSQRYVRLHTNACNYQIGS